MGGHAGHHHGRTRRSSSWADTPVRPYAHEATALGYCHRIHHIRHQRCLRGTVACATGSKNVADTLSGSKGEALAVGAGLTGQPCKEYKATELKGVGSHSQYHQIRAQAFCKETLATNIEGCGKPFPRATNMEGVGRLPNATPSTNDARLFACPCGIRAEHRHAPSILTG
jgi:hypothetical protein